MTREEIRRHAEVALQAAARLEVEPGDVVTTDQLVAWAETHFNVRQGEAARLFGDESGHVPWVRSKGADLFPETGFWRHYQRFVEQSLPRGPLNQLDEVTRDILDELEDPSRDGQWDRRGLVMGHVQSGKTNNYLGLVAKAADAGYRLIVVLAGVHNNLRAQTQHRMDEAVYGRDTRDGEAASRWFGVGAFQDHPPMISLTSADEAGDFKKATADRVGNPFDRIDVPTVFVIKKHVTILENLHDWLKDNSNRPAGHERISGVPFLLIDDEADNASIDTADHDRDGETEPTRTNRGIRRLLHLFDQSAYVGYTATPFANVFIDDRAHDDDVGDDLFPRDFIFALEPPSNYVGPRRVFGIAGARDDDVDDEGLPMVNHVMDADEWLPDRHSAGFRPDEELFPASLRRAIDSFVLSIAARRHRGEHSSHNSMLVHVTRFTETQNEVQRQIRDVLIDLRNEILYASDPATVDRLCGIWEADFLPVADALSDDDDPPVRHQFEEIEPHLRDAVNSIQTRAINGTSADILDYFDHERGLSAIVVGGAKLSRGLTLEGLSVSYYLRATRMYDTLMQMGRWFGYRPGYLDLCRIYTAPAVVTWYRNIAQATEELLIDFRSMQAAGGRPKDFGLRVRHSPGMMITSAAKMRNGVLRRVAFGNTRPETTSLEIGPAVRSMALAHAETLFESLGTQTQTTTSEDRIWANVDAQPILEYFDRLKSDGLYGLATSARPGYLLDYLQQRVSNGGLVRWTVLLKSNSQAASEGRINICGDKLSVGLSTRTDRAGIGHYAFKSLIGSADEAVGLTDQELARARSSASPNNPTGAHFRRARPADHGLLIFYLLRSTGVETLMKRPDGPSSKKLATHIQPGDPFTAFCVSFPAVDDDALVEYRVNNVFDRDMGGATE